jgi:tetratricopeptide (TPR) repeat protein
MAATDVDEKVRAYSEAIQLYPDYSEAFRNRGIARQKAGDFDGALDDYKQTIHFKADDFHAYHNRSVIHAEMGDLARAQVDFDMAVGLKRDFTWKYLQKGMESRSCRKGQFETAVREFNESIRLNPNSAEAYFNRGKTRREQGDVTEPFRISTRNYDLSRALWAPFTAGDSSWSKSFRAAIRRLSEISRPWRWFA